MKPSSTYQKKRALRLSPAYLFLLVSLIIYGISCLYVHSQDVPEAVSGTAETPARPASSRFTHLVPDGYGTPVRCDLTANHETFSLFEDNGTYAMKGPYTGEIDQRTAQSILAAGASILSRDTLSLTPEEAGLTPPVLTAVYTYADGRKLTLSMGDSPATGSGRYAMVEGDSHVYLVNSALYEKLSVSPLSMILPPALDSILCAQTIQQLQIRLPGAEPLLLQRTDPDNPYRTVCEMVSPFHWPVNSERTGKLFLAIESLKPLQAAVLSAPEFLAEFSVTGPEGYLSFTLLSENGHLYLQPAGDSLAYLLADDACDFLSEVRIPYLAEQLPALVSLDCVNTLILEQPSESHTLDCTASLLDGKPVSSEELKSRYTAVISLLLDGYLEEGPSAGKKLLTVHFELTDGTDFHISFYDYDGTYALIDRMGARHFLIQKTKLKALMDLF